MLSNLLNPLAIIISLSTASGILVHDTHIDQAVSSSLAMPAILANVDPANKLGAEGHTHVERTSVSQVITTMHSRTPGMQPRQDKRHLMQKHVARGHHAFDNYSLPIV
jgi:hypothetical protein